MKKICQSLLLLVTVTVVAQDIATSPYSALGIGDKLFDNNTELAGMAGMSAAMESVFGQSANFSNPAANPRLAYTSFAFGVNSDANRIESSNGSDQRGTTYISNISLAVPINEKTKAGFSFQPYSADGYDLQRITEVEGQPAVINDFEGTGGINALSFIGSRNIGQSLSLGVRADYLFGNITRDEIIRVEGADLLTDYKYTNQIRGFQFTGAAFWRQKLKNDNELHFGATYTAGTDLNSDVENLITTSFPVNGVAANLDTISRQTLTNGTTTLPQELKLGVSYTKKFNWLIGAEVQMTNGSNLELALEDRSDVNYVNGFRASLGGFWLPDYNSYKSYFERVTYRAGMFYEATPLEVNDTRINKYGITFGLRMPVGKTQDYSALNMAIELGRRGTMDNNLIRENYAAFKIGFTLDARWFQKRIYD